MIYAGPGIAMKWQLCTFQKNGVQTGAGMGEGTRLQNNGTLGKKLIFDLFQKFEKMSFHK